VDRSGGTREDLLVNTQRIPPSDMPRSNPRFRKCALEGSGRMANRLRTTTMYVAALFTVWGDDRARAFLEQVKANGTRIASSNGEVVGSSRPAKSPQA